VIRSNVKSRPSQVKRRWKKKEAAVENIRTAFLKRYTLGQRLGAGGQAEVYKCSKDNTDYAVKIIDKRKLQDNDLHQMKLEVEIHALVSDHLQIITLVEHIASPKVEYLVMEIANGGELYGHIVKRDKYTEGCARRYAEQLFSVVAHLHSKGIMHRDIKPKNILCESMSEDTQLKLCDFGLAARLGPDDSVDDGVVRGTPEFVSHEIVQGLPYGHPSDVWSLGVVMFMLLTGRLPFDDPESEQNNKTKKKDFEPLFEVIAAGTPTFDLEADTCLSDAAKDFVLSLLCPDRHKRPTCAQALQHRFLTGLEHSDQELITVRPGLSNYMKKFLGAKRRLTHVRRLTGILNRGAGNTLKVRELEQVTSETTTLLEEAGADEILQVTQFNEDMTLWR